MQVESLVLARDSAAANHKRELAAAQRDAAQVEAQHKSAAASWHTDLDWHRSEVRSCCLRPFLCCAVASMHAPAAPMSIDHVIALDNCARWQNRVYTSSYVPRMRPAAERLEAGA